MLTSTWFISMAMLAGCAGNSNKPGTSDPNGAPELIITTSQNPSNYGQSVTFCAKASSNLTGSITFYDSTSPIGTSDLNANIATFTTSALAAGIHVITATWSGNTQNHTVTSNLLSQNVTSATSPIVWPTPAPITYGTPLSAAQLNASSQVAGTFSYSPDQGSILSAGQQTLSVSFTPLDATNYSISTQTVQIIVNRATLTVAVNNASLTYGAMLPPLSGTIIGALPSDGITASYTTSATSKSAAGTYPIAATLDDPNHRLFNYSVSNTPGTLTVLPNVIVNFPETDLLGGESFNFTAAILGTSIALVDWEVNGVVGGTPTIGTITQSGLYTAPQQFSGSVQVSAVLHSEPSAFGSTTVKIVSATPKPGKIGFTFRLPKNAATSAGVYDLSGNLVRTLWSNLSYAAGPHAEEWDEKDDFGTTLTGDSYQIRLLYNNVTYTWGLIGDTSSSWQGPNNWDLQSNLPTSMAIIGSQAIVTNGYSEGGRNTSYFALSAPQTPSVFVTTGGCDAFEFSSTDGNLVYLANAGTGWEGSNAFVIAFDPNSRRQVSFVNGTSITYCGKAVDGIIDNVPNAATNPGVTRSHIPTGIAVQPNGNILAVSHGSYFDFTNSLAQTFPSEDRIILFDKRSGALLGKVNIANPQQLVFSTSGDLWVISGESVILLTSVGTKNLQTIALTGLSHPLAIARDPSTDDILVADGGTSQQVKRFASNGAFLTSYGDYGGYNDCDPGITSTRLRLDNSPESGAEGRTFLAVEPDGTWWIGDPGNQRLLHFTSDGAYLEQISFLRYLYSVTADHTVPSRVFAAMLEYSVDYSHPLTPGDPDPALGGTGSWTLTKNWSVCLPNNYGHYFVGVHTFGNGGTYASIVNTDVKNNLFGGGAWELAELPSSGPIRFSNRFLEYDRYHQLFNHSDGLSYWDATGTPDTQVAYLRTLAGYDSNGFPIWNDPTRLASVPTNNSDAPIGLGGTGMYHYPEPTSTGIIATYRTQIAQPGVDHHVGGVHVGSDNWTWEASPGALISVPDEQGTFPDLDSYGGHDGITVLVEGRSIFQGYDGQWGSYSSQWMQWWDDGLLVGQFGHSAHGLEDDGSLFPGAAGNISTMATVSVGNDVYLYNSDEGYHPGIHQWKISGLDSIHELAGTAALGGIVSLADPSLTQ